MNEASTRPAGAPSGRPAPTVPGLRRDALFLTRVALGDEHRDLLASRLRLVYALGLGVSLALIGAARLLDPGPHAAWENLLDGAIIASFAAGWLALRAGWASIGRQEWIAVAVLSFNAIVIPMQTSDYPIALGAALLLFVPAAVIPWRPVHQIGLGTLLVLAYLIYQLLYVASPMGALAWADRGGAGAFRLELLTTLTGLAVLVATSVLVTHTLYNLRRTARAARSMGAYVIDRELARGGMSQVVLAEHARMCRPAAIKILAPRPGEDEEVSIARFEREVRLASTLSHPNTITIYDYGRDDEGGFYYAMEYLQGWNLDELVETDGPLAPGRVVHILRQVCGALAEAHSAGVVHRDLKPSNIFLTRRGGIPDFVKVLDFGIARSFETSLDAGTPDGRSEPATVTAAGVVVGTPAYLPPEAATGTGRVGPWGDIYSLGGVAFHLLTGRPPFVADSPMELLVAHLTEAPPIPSTVARQNVPAELDRIVLRCLEKAPEDRFESVQALIESLESVALTERWTLTDAAAWWRVHAPPPVGLDAED